MRCDDLEGGMGDARQVQEGDVYLIHFVVQKLLSLISLYLFIFVFISITLEGKS